MVKIFPTIEALNNFAAEKFVEMANAFIDSTSQNFKVALSGGSTPKALFRLLASKKFRDKVNWQQVYFFFGDERNVPLTDAESNFRMAKENLFEPLQISQFNIERWETEQNNPEKVAKTYEGRLRLGFSLAGNADRLNSNTSDTEKVNWVPSFDLILLGMGADGHTASLFPFTEALHETERLAVANYVEKLNDWRFTLTFPVINNARNVIFLVAGEEKAETLRQVLEGDFEPDRFPSQNVNPENGELFWLLDKNVAKLLKTDGN
jgi:6-phosphogluconolactonase